MNKLVEEALNRQIKDEFQSAYTYLAMSSYCESINLSGFANWMQKQYEEETAHALRLFNFLNDRDGEVELLAIEKPNSKFESPLHVFESVLEHEKKITNLIHNLYALAVKENDYPTQVEMQWFITEQVEEEKNAGDIVSQLNLAGNNNIALMMLDRELSTRTTEATQ